MLRRSFCKCLSLQTGTVILAFAFVEIALIILVSNLHLITEFPPALGFILCFVFVMLIAGAVLIQACYRENRILCLVGFAFVVLVLLLFVLGSVISFANQRSLTDYVCVEDRCPETLWCAELQYRELPATNGSKKYNVTENAKELEDVNLVEEQTTTEDYSNSESPEEPSEEPEEEEESSDRRRRDLDDPFTSSTDEPPEETEADYEELEETEPAESTTSEYEFSTEEATTLDSSEVNVYIEEGADYIIGVALFIAVLLFCINLTFFLFTCTIVFSYYQELVFVYNYQKNL